VLITIRLENHFWDVLSEIAARESRTTNELAEIRDDASNFASILRVCCLRYLSQLAGRIHETEETPIIPLRAVR